MVLKQILMWWYGPGWSNSFKAITRRLELLADELSFEILFKTLFEPWKQIKTYLGPNASLDLRVRVLFDNLFARCFGFVLRISVITIGVILLALTAVLGVLLALVWPAVPFLPVILVFLAVLGL